MKNRRLFFFDRRVFAKSLFAVWLIIVSAVGAGKAGAQDVVVPNFNELVEGNSANCIPLTGCLDWDRYQQVFDMSQFGTLPAQPPLLFISEIRFRPSADDGSGIPPFPGASFADIEINLSTPIATGADLTTLIGPDNLFDQFDLNIGPDAANVYRGGLTLSSLFTGPGPFDFDIVITLQTPFLYDPAVGNLLFEWKNRSGESFGGFVDSENFFGDSVSRLINSPLDGPDAITGFPDTSGLITKFTFIPADEISVTNAVTPVADDFPVVNLPQFFTQIADVVVAGTTSADFCVALDPREIIKKGKPKFKQRFLNVSELSFSGSCGDLSAIDLSVAPWFRGYPGKFPADETGVEGVWLVVAAIQSTAQYLGPVEVETFPDALINFSDLGVTPNRPDCNAELPWREITLGGAVPAFGDFPNAEGTRMIPETARCNSGRSLTRRTTHVYPVRLDAKSNQERINIQWQLSGLSQTIEEAGLCVDVDSLTGLGLIQASLDATQPAIAQGRYEDAQARLEQIARDAKFNSNNFSGCPIEANYTGNFMSRGLVGAFTIWDRFLHPDEGAGWEIYTVPADLGVFE